MDTKQVVKTAAIIVFFWLFIAMSGFAEDSDLNRATLKGLYALRVSIEDMQPNIQAYAEKHGLTAKQIQSDIEKKLGNSGIKIVSGDAWLAMPGKPILYVNINTHETEKYWYAYDIKVELRQLVRLEANPIITTLATTWSINITGIANIGNLPIIRNDLLMLVDRFMNAHRMVNRN